MATDLWIELPVENGGGGGGGTVTSVGLTVPSSLLTVTGSPVTTSGTIALSLNAQSANTVFAGPASGSSAPPTFRSLVTADLPAGIGTVTSVGLSSPGVLYSVSGSPITTAGTLALNLISQAQNFVLAGPTSGSGNPSFRALSSGDISTLTAANISATSNSTLTSLPNLVSIGTVTTGVWNGTPTSGQSFITTGTTYTTPAGITTSTIFKFTLIGGGGGGGGGSSGATGASGNAGGTGIMWLTGLAATTAYTVTIGSFGAAGLAAANGGAGGTTSITIGSSIYIANGGPGGISNSGVFVPGGTLVGFPAGSILINGQSGIVGGSTFSGGAGGSTPFGFGGPIVDGAGTGQNGTGYGAGGAGARGTGNIGGAGTQGAIIVEWKN